MMNNEALQEIVRDLGELQDSVSQGNLNDHLLMEKINKIRKMAFDEASRAVPRFAEDEILDGYYKDALEQARRFVELAIEATRGRQIPPMTMVNLVYCADLFATKVQRWFHLRNLRALREVTGSREVQ